jgi:hypothetical protein
LVMPKPRDGDALCRHCHHGLQQGLLHVKADRPRRARMPRVLDLRILLTHRLGLIDLELRVSIVAEDLFELEHVTRPVTLKQDHLHLAVRC